MKQRILIVDDIPDNLRVIGSALSSKYEIPCALSGEEALRIIGEHKPDLILLDVMMPGMSGYDVLAEIKKNPETANIPVIFVTANNDSDSESLALTQGAVDFIHKPINPDVVRARVGLHLEMVARENRLREANDFLESRVDERTRELDATIHNLRLAKEAAESASKAKSIFLTNMSHELRTPVHGIMGLASVISRRADKPDIQDKGRRILVTSDHLLGLLNQLFDLSQLEANYLPIEPTRFQIGILSENIIAMFSHLAADKGLVFEVLQDESTGKAHVIGDALRIQQILANLVGNAIKFTDRGHVRVIVRVDNETSDELSLVLEVEDSGIGISAEDLERIFLPFEQGDSTLTRRTGGAGLGLPISKQLVTLMGGTIDVSSMPTLGSVFTVTLRLQKTDMTEDIGLIEPFPIDTPVVDQPAISHRVLLVEDEMINREFAVRLLSRQEGVAVDIATNGQDAVEMARNSPYELILMDVMMPVMDGVAATKAIRDLPGYSLTPIIALTAKSAEIDKAEYISAGMNDVLTKPIKSTDLLKRVNYWMKRHSPSK